MQVTVWAAYFRQVVERSRLEEHARRVALRMQPREQFIEMASRVWEVEVLPNWAAERTTRRTLMLWWEGVPEYLRGDVWPRALAPTSAPPPPSPSGASSSSTASSSLAPSVSLPDGVLAYDRIRTMLEKVDHDGARATCTDCLSPASSSAAAAAAISAAAFGAAAAPSPTATRPISTAGADAADEALQPISRANSTSGVVRTIAPELNMFTSTESPLNASLLSLLACCHASARLGGPPPPPFAPLLGCVLTWNDPKPRPGRPPWLPPWLPVMPRGSPRLTSTTPSASVMPRGSP